MDERVHVSRETYLMMQDWNDSNPEAGPDSSLVRAARSGDRTAYGELYRRYAPMVHGLILARVAPDHAEDLVQEVFLKAMTQIVRLREVDHFGGWIAAIARNHVTDQYRRNREIQSSEDFADNIVNSEDTNAQSEARTILAAIQSLPDAYRETLTCRLVEGMTGPEIARKTGLTHESVRVNLHRGMKMLRERLGAPGARTSGEKGDQNHA
jgi:RNA polymerase sigma-70 factor (ECF subfamily)